MSDQQHEPTIAVKGIEVPAADEPETPEEAPQALRVYRMGDLPDDRKKPNPTIIAGLPFRRGEITLVSAPKKHGKSWVLSELLVQVANGGLIFGEHQVLEPGRSNAVAACCFSGNRGS